ncbi:type VII secretion protein EssC [Candidatus Saccharibacteria bacterium]|nr:type VII secretion protein EssC [Candidatus Saccharibacteria bacterium]
MIIHVFNERVNISQTLSSKAGGMYPIYVDRKIMANIVADNGAWTIKLSSTFSSKDFTFERPRLELYKIYIITSKITNESFFLIATPRYSQNMKSYDLLFNQVTIGNNPNCDIYYPLQFSNSEFLRITQVNTKWIIETNSLSFFISGKRAKNGQELLNGDYIFFYGMKLIFANSRLTIDNPNNLAEIKTGRLKNSEPEKVQAVAEPVNNDNREYLPLYTEKDYFFKSPRFNYVIEEAEVEINEPPQPEGKNDIPAILTVGPQLTMAAASMLSMVGMIIMMNSSDSNRPTAGIYLGTMAVTLLGTLMWPLITRKYNSRRLKRREEKRVKKYTKYLEQKQRLINFIKANQKQTLLENNPSPQRCVEIIENRDKALWQRSISNSDFLSIRLGIGQVPTKIAIEKPKEQFSVDDDDGLLLEMKKTVNDSLNIADAPITYNFTERNIDAIVGDIDLVQRFMDCIFLQITTFHSYADLKIVVFTQDENRWSYLKIAPHLWDNQKSIRYFATSVEKLTIISNELEKIFDARVANDEEVKMDDDGEQHDSQTSYKDFRPYYLFFIDDMAAVRNVSLINKILRYKRNLGFSIVALSNSISMLPNETTDFICVSRQGSSIMSGDSSSNNKSFTADFNDGMVDMYYCMQKLANIPVLIEKGKFELPSSISFLELYNYGRVEQFNSLARWSKNNPSVSLSVPIGIDQNNEIFKMDIHEKAYGPHGLIAGTTGSGKSEWIITYILSLAVNFNPDEVQFVLIDYKGGGLAKSFENAEMNVKLPHLAGTITNLDKSEIFRSISAIESELKRRQAIFNAARERLKEGSMDIYKYQQYYRKGLVDSPMSHLLIICDEFAELKQQEPDFMEQLISTSRIGRSLGVHLILATQKPSGVVNDQIWSNSKFKVCLKVQDRGDSNEILKKPDAAFLKQTGTFYLQVGNDDYYNLGQVAWAGAKYYPSDIVEHEMDSSVQCIDDIGRIVEVFKEEKEKKENQGEQLLNIVAYISDVCRQGNYVCRQMWLKNIEQRIFLSDLRKKYKLNSGEKYTYNTVIGEYDEPREQKQGALNIDLAAGNIAIVGRADTSIDKLISTMVWSSIVDHTPAEIAYYIIDFGAETLKKFAKFPHVGEVVFQDEMDKVGGILNLISEEIEKRKDILSNYNGSFEYYNKTEQEKMNLIVVVINNYDVFTEVLPRSMDLLSEMFRDAPKYGIVFVISANATNAIGNRQLQFFNHLIIMQLNDDSMYRSITNCRRGLIPKKVVGRGICKVDASNNDSYCEFQTAMIAPEEEELKIIKAYANECIEYYKCKVKQLTKVPDNVSSDDLLKYITDLSNVPIGTDLYEKTVANYDFLSQKLHLITGKNIEEGMNFIYGLASILSKVPNTRVRVVDLLDVFKKPLIDIKMFDEDINVVFAALEKDTLTRTENQDYGITLVLGAGQFKNHLSQAGIEVFNNLFEHLGESKKSIYVLIDDYESMRTLKLEKWFNELADVSKGIWYGVGLDNQSLFECEPVRSEDNKLNFAGLAFDIDKKNYRVIKTLMDEDE